MKLIQILFSLRPYSHYVYVNPNSGSVNADRYLEILENGALTFIEELLTLSDDPDTIAVAAPDAYLFMHDNAPCHKATKVTNYLKKRRVRVMK